MYHTLLAKEQGSTTKQHQALTTRTHSLSVERQRPDVPSQAGRVRKGMDLTCMRTASSCYPLSLTLYSQSATRCTHLVLGIGLCNDLLP